MKVVGSKITSKFQLTLPKDVRTAIGVREGDSVDFAIEGGSVLLFTKKSDPIKALAELSEGKFFPSLAIDAKKSRKEGKREKSIA